MQSTATATEPKKAVDKRLLNAIKDEIGSSEKNLYSSVSNLIINEKVNVNALDEDGCSALHYAAEKGKDEIVKLLLKNGANFDLRSKYKNSALILATINSQAKVVDSLLKAGADVNLTNDFGESALNLAAWEGRVEIVDSLLNAGADVSNMPSDGFCIGRTAIEIVAQKTSTKQKNIFTKLYEMGSTLNLNFSNDKNIFIPEEMKNLFDEYNKFENTAERDKNLLKNTNLQGTFKKSILAGKPLHFMIMSLIKCS